MQFEERYRVARSGRTCANVKRGRITERDRRAIKCVTKPMLGFKTFRAAVKVLAGVELMHMICKDQFVIHDAGAVSLANQFYVFAGQIGPI